MIDYTLTRIADALEKLVDAYAQAQRRDHYTLTAADRYAANEARQRAEASLSVTPSTDATVSDSEPDPLDEDDHRDRIDGDGQRWGRMDGGCWHHEGKYPHDFGRCSWTLQQLQDAYGLLTFAPEAAQDATGADLTASQGESGDEGGGEAKETVEPLLCPGCGHEIDSHGWEADYAITCCLACDDPADCREAPSDIARALIEQAGGRHG